MQNIINLANELDVPSFNTLLITLCFTNNIAQVLPTTGILNKFTCNWKKSVERELFLILARK